MRRTRTTCDPSGYRDDRERAVSGGHPAERGAGDEDLRVAERALRCGVGNVTADRPGPLLRSQRGGSKRQQQRRCNRDGCSGEPSDPPTWCSTTVVHHDLRGEGKTRVRLRCDGGEVIA